MTQEVFEVVQLFPPCSWEVDGEKITFPIEGIQENYANRIAEHKRLYRDGARLDDTGSDPTTWTITVAFYNLNDEPGIDDPETQYPDVVDRLTDACKIHETGTLITPTRGARRCRAMSYDRVDSFEDRDVAAVTFTFLEDNEDDATQQDFKQVNGASAARKTANEGKALADAEGAGGGFDMSDLNQFAGELEGLANAPGEFVGDIEAKANAIQNKVQSVEDTFTNAKNEAVTETTLLLTNPSASTAGRRLRSVADQAKGTAERKAAGQLGGITTITFTRTVSIFDVAAKVNQNSEELIGLNFGIEDMMNIPAQTAIRVFDTPSVANSKKAG